MTRHIAVLLSLISLSAAADPPPSATITFLHVNDTHGVGVTPDAAGDCALARAATVIRRIRSEQGPARVFLSVGGDIGVHPHDEDLLTRRTGGLAEVLALNALGVDAMTPGNHEFDHGLEGLRRLESASTFPWISANVLVKGTKDLAMRGGGTASFAVDGMSVMFVGLSPGPLQQWNVLQGAGNDVDAVDGIAWAGSAVVAGRRPASILVALSHMGQDRDELLARTVPGFDLILGAHTHTENPGLVVEATRIVQARWHYDFVARVDVRMERSGAAWRVASSSSSLIPTAGEKPDPEMVALLQGLVRLVEAGKPLPLPERK